MNVKQERQDEAEIRELAAKLMEANKVKMNSPQRHQQQQSQNINLLNFLSGGDKTKSKNSGGTNEVDTKNIDEESVKGRFGWTMMGKIHIPYILRSGEKYCAVRMVEMKVLNKLLNFLHQDLYNCTNIRSYYITEAEARLLNEINFKHCDYQFGREQFTSRDLIVRLVDGNEFYQFLGHCYAKLSNNDTEKVKNLDRCGFIRINKESVVPYTLYNELKYVPLFYFEGETDNLRQRADKLEGWDLAYLKFCCKVQGIRNELFAHETCSVISLNDIKNYFPPGTIFEDYWPKKNLESQLLISKTSTPSHNTIQWTRQPTAPPNTHPSPSPKPATQAKAPNSHMHNMHMYPNYTMAGGQPSYHGTQPRTATGAVRSTYPSATNRMRPYYSSMGQAPPPLIRANASTSGPDDNTSSSSPSYQTSSIKIKPRNELMDPERPRLLPSEISSDAMEVTVTRCYENDSDESEELSAPQTKSEPSTSEVRRNIECEPPESVLTRAYVTVTPTGRKVFWPSQRQVSRPTQSEATRPYVVVDPTGREVVWPAQREVSRPTQSEVTRPSVVVENDSDESEELSDQSEPSTSEVRRNIECEPPESVLTRSYVAVESTIIHQQMVNISSSMGSVPPDELNRINYQRMILDLQGRGLIPADFRPSFTPQEEVSLNMPPGHMMTRSAQSQTFFHMSHAGMAAAVRPSAFHPCPRMPHAYMASEPRFRRPQTPGPQGPALFRTPQTQRNMSNQLRRQQVQTFPRRGRSNNSLPRSENFPPGQMEGNRRSNRRRQPVNRFQIS
ncbi:uncharacterized protein [Diabrotica undecimpunctata]|uniref:uncharacterized protein isoform X3 n=1 Tax=Diabrotica undecimpunctata TaxID=50387 RepID=UPI003B63B0CA